ncbi:MAG: A/G-specific adenine glycosylase, partial [Candidatus Aminicenantes bacterium]|nr:A/G-specific adenine glycosylase [Candidatus Aminicenantes bacterium]
MRTSSGHIRPISRTVGAAPAAPRVRRALLRWYRARRRALPWRGETDPYKILVSEVMLQQTTVPAVVPYYERWIALFPNVESLGRAPLRKVLKAWQGLGYYQRARNLRAAAQVVVDRHGGRVPDDPAGIAKLPGVGPYTAAAVLSIAFGKPYPVIDANVRRLMMRFLAIRDEAVAGRDAKIRPFLEAAISRRSPGDFNQALMELGGRVCRSRRPLCAGCPVRADCAAFAKGIQEIIPAPRTKTTKRIEAVVAVVERDGAYLIRKRPERGLLGGLWEFPGGKREPGETRTAALRRELREEVGVPSRDEKLLVKVRHAYTQFQVDLYAYRCALAGEPRPRPGRLTWATLAALRRYPFPSGSAK